MPTFVPSKQVSTGPTVGTFVPTTPPGGKKKNKGKSVFGFVHNVEKGVVNATVGAVPAAYEAGKAVVKDTNDIIHGGLRQPKQGNKVDPYKRTAAIGKAVAKQYAATYGPLVHGDVDTFLDNVYNDPVAITLDAATIASLGIGGAARLSLIPARGGKVLELTTASGKTVTKPLARGEMRAQIQALTAKAKNAPIKVGPIDRPAGMAAAKIERTKLIRKNVNVKAQNAAYNRSLRKLRGQPAKVAAFLHGRFDRQGLNEYMGILADEAKANPKGPAASTLKLLSNPRVQKLFDNPDARVLKVVEEAKKLGGKQADLLHVSPDVAEAGRYRAARIAGGARLEKGEWKGGPPIEELKARGLDPAYFPDVPEAKFADAAFEGRGGGLGVPQRSAHTRQNSGALMLAGQLVHDPAVLNQSWMNAVKYAHYNDIHQSLLDQAVPATHIPRGYKAVRAKRGERIDPMDRTRGGFSDWVETHLDEAGDVISDDPGLVTKSELEAMKNTDGLYMVVPDKIAKTMTGEFTKAGSFERAMRSPMKVWRALVLGGRPAYLVNNAVGNTLMYLFHSGRPEDLRQLAGAFKQFAKPSEHAAIDRLLEKHFAGQVQGGFVATQFPDLAPRSAVGRAAAATFGFIPKLDKRWEQALRRAKVQAELKRHPELKRIVENMGKDTATFEDLLHNPHGSAELDPARLQSPAREAFQREIESRFPGETDDVMALTDLMASYGAREKGIPLEQAYDDFVKGVTGAEADAGALAQVAAPDVRYTPKQIATRIKSKHNPRHADKGVPKTPDMWATAPNGERYKLAGNITPEDWVQRVRAVVPDKELRDNLARWYEHYEPMFREMFGPDADEIMRGFAVSQANASPSSGLGAVLKVMDKTRRGEEVGPREISVVGQHIQTAVRNGEITKGVAAKLSDFVDSLVGKDTRTWMGDLPEGGRPVAVDVHAIRDRGIVDHKQRARLTARGYQEGKDFIVEGKGSATGPLYERIAEWYHGVADHLNDIEFDGRSDWTPAQAQALGWSAIQMAHGVVPEGFAEAFARNSRAIDFEVTKGTGRLGDDLSLEQSHQVAEAMRADAEELARSIPGMYVRGVDVGTGGWNQGSNATVRVTVIGSEETVQNALTKFAQAFDQEWVQASREVTGKNSRAAVLIDSAAFENADEMARFFQALNRIEPKLEGYMPYDVDGTPGLAIRTNSRSVSPKTKDKFLAKYEAAITQAEQETGIEVGYNVRNIELLTGGQHGAEAPIHTLPGGGGGRAALDDPLASRIRRKLERTIDEVRGGPPPADPQWQRILEGVARGRGYVGKRGQLLKDSLEHAESYIDDFLRENPNHPNARQLRDLQERAALERVSANQKRFDDFLSTIDKPKVEPRRLGKEAWDMEGRPGHVYHGTRPETADKILSERRVRVGSRAPEAAWFSEDPRAAAFFGDEVLEFPKSVLPESAQEGRFGAIGSPEDVLFQGKAAPEGTLTHEVQVPTKAYTMTKAEAYAADPDPGFVYHGTSDEAAARIMEQRRIAPGGPLGGFGDTAWVSEDPYLAATHAGKSQFHSTGQGGGGTVIAIPKESIPPSAVKFSDSGTTTWSSGEGYLFQKNRRGAFNTATKLIHLFDNADPSTIVHEFVHAIDTGGGFTKKHIDILEEYSGATHGTRDFSEAVAQGFEQYLREGHAPTRALEGLFARWKALLSNIYKRVADLGTPINDDVRRVFDEVLTPPAHRPQPGSKIEALDIALTTHPDIAYQIYDRVNDALGDYDHLSHAEKAWMRNMFPFYAWYKAIAGIALKTTLEQPLKVNLLSHLANIAIERNLEAAGLNEDEIPSSLKGLITLHIDPDGRVVGLPTAAVNPYATVGQLTDFVGAAASGEPGAAGRTLPGLNPLLGDVISQVWGSTPQGYDVHGVGTVESLPFSRLLKAWEADGGPDVPFMGPAATKDPMYDHAVKDELLRYLGFPYARVSKSAAKRVASRDR